MVPGPFHVIFHNLKGHNQTTGIFANQKIWVFLGHQKTGLVNGSVAETQLF
jgi:hypothetical protein